VINIIKPTRDKTLEKLAREVKADLEIIGLEVLDKTQGEK